MVPICKQQDRKITIFRTNPGWLRLEAPSNEANTEHGFNFIFKLPYKLLKSYLTTLRENGNPHLKMGEASAMTAIDTLNSSTETHTKKREHLPLWHIMQKVKNNVIFIFFKREEEHRLFFYMKLAPQRNSPYYKCSNNSGS